MALIINASNNFIEIALDALTDFDSRVDLVGYGLARNAPEGLRIRKITFVPSAIGDQVREIFDHAFFRFSPVIDH